MDDFENRLTGLLTKAADAKNYAPADLDNVMRRVRQRRNRHVLAAVVVLALVVGAGALATQRDGSDSIAADAGKPVYLIPSVLPDGLVLRWKTDGAQLPIERNKSFHSVFSDGGDRRVVVLALRWDGLGQLPSEPDELRSIDFGFHAQWRPDPDTYVSVATNGLTRAETLAIARSVHLDRGRGERAYIPASVPGGLAKVYEGDYEDLVDRTGSILTYAAPGTTPVGDPVFQVNLTVSRSSSLQKRQVQLIQFQVVGFTPRPVRIGEADGTIVRSQIGPMRNRYTLTFERDSVWVEIDAVDVPEEAVLAMARSLRDVSAEEWDAYRPE